MNKTPDLRIEPLESRIALTFAAVVDLNALDGQNGYRIGGFPQTTVQYGISITGTVDSSDAGDVNGDGYGDVILGHFRQGPGSEARGDAWLLFGGLTATAEVDRGTGTKLTGGPYAPDTENNFFGWSASSATTVSATSL